MKALELDDTSSEVYSALGRLRQHQGDREGAERALKRALEINPNDISALGPYSNHLQGSGDLKGFARLRRKGLRVGSPQPQCPGKPRRQFIYFRQI